MAIRTSELPSYDLVIPALLEFGFDELKSKCKLTPGVPLKPMLAKPTKAIGEVLDRCEGKQFTCEYKYDGERAQVCRMNRPFTCRNSALFIRRFTSLKTALFECSVATRKI